MKSVTFEKLKYKQKFEQADKNAKIWKDRFEKLANMVGGTLRNAMAKWRETIVSNTETQTTDTYKLFTMFP